MVIGFDRLARQALAGHSDGAAESCEYSAIVSEAPARAGVVSLDAPWFLAGPSRSPFSKLQRFPRKLCN
jgi:hypothetical protein